MPFPLHPTIRDSIGPFTYRLTMKSGCRVEDKVQKNGIHTSKTKGKKIMWVKGGRTIREERNESGGERATPSMCPIRKKKYGANTHTHISLSQFR